MLLQCALLLSESMRVLLEPCRFPFDIMNEDR